MTRKWPDGEPSDHGTALGVHLRELTALGARLQEVQVGAQVARLPLKEPGLRGVGGLSGALCWGSWGSQICGRAAGGNGARA